MQIAEKHEGLQSQQRQAKHLFQTLLHKTFQGELTTDERDGRVPDVEVKCQSTAELRRVAEALGRDAYQMTLPME